MSKQVQYIQSREVTRQRIDGSNELTGELTDRVTRDNTKCMHPFAVNGIGERQLPFETAVLHGLFIVLANLASKPIETI